jgi:hypothetical protein
MEPRRKNHLRNCRRAWRRIQFSLAASCSFALLAILPAQLNAQQPPTGLVAPGNAAVTGFSGASPPIQIAAGADPGENTLIDLNGPSLRVVDLQHMGGSPTAQFVGAPKPFTFSAAAVGQVFGVALDDNAPPNIYVAASSAYGLPIVVPGPNGQPQHTKVGAPNAAYMRGLWGLQGGPGSIWKIDGTTGKVSLFANVMLDGRSNSGPALGGLAYDAASKLLFAADRETGFIHRFGMDGHELGRYDHGVTGRAAQGLPPVHWPQQRIDVTSPQFDSTAPATWNYAAPERRIFGLAIYQHRLYYSVADSLQVWSVGLKADGAFDSDAVIELAAPPAAGPTEISKITFDEQGRMFLAERPATTGAFDFEVLAVPAIGRVLRYAVVGTTTAGRRIWQQVPDEYAIGFPRDLRNGNGGVAIGYGYDAKGNLSLTHCGGFMWSTGEDLRDSSDAALTEKLKQSGPLYVDGLQGNETWRIRRDNEPPLVSYFIDYDDAFVEDAARGHMGDIAIVRACPSLPPPQIQIYPTTPGGPPGVHPGKPGTPGTPPGTPGTPPGTPGTPPSGGCPPNQVRNVRTGECGQCPRPGIQINGKCCSVATIAANAACSNSSCPSGQTAIGPSNFCCNSSQVYTGAGGAPACCSGQVANGQCQTSTTPPITSNCPSGYVAFGSACCLASQMTSTGICCPSGQVPSGPNKSQCQTFIYVPVKPPRQCCASGSIPTASGKCCSTANVTSNGVCCAGPVNLADRTHCPVPTPTCATGYTRVRDGSCCNNRFLSADGASCKTGRKPCGRGQFRDTNGACAPIPRGGGGGCAPGEMIGASGNCVPVPPTAGCPAGQFTTAEGNCVPSGPPPRIRGHKEHRGGVVPPSRAGPRRPGIAAAPPPRPAFRGPFGGRRGFFRR